MTNKLHQPDRVTYSEAVKINIGDYESRDVHISFSSEIKEGETFQKAVSRTKVRVQKELLKREREIRQSSVENVDFETMNKL